MCHITVFILNTRIFLSCVEFRHQFQNNAYFFMRTFIKFLTLQLYCLKMFKTSLNLDTRYIHVIPGDERGYYWGLKAQLISAIEQLRTSGCRALGPSAEGPACFVLRSPSSSWRACFGTIFWSEIHWAPVLRPATVFFLPSGICCLRTLSSDDPAVRSWTPYEGASRRRFALSFCSFDISVLANGNNMNINNW